MEHPKYKNNDPILVGDTVKFLICNKKGNESIVAIDKIITIYRTYISIKKENTSLTYDISLQDVSTRILHKINKIEYTYMCPSCGFETNEHKEIIDHISKNDWYCWHKEESYIVNIKPTMHYCDREYCEYNASK